MSRVWLALILTACGAPAVPTSTVRAPEEEVRPYAVALRLEDAGEHEEEPRTRVSLVRITPEGERTITSLSVEPGACYHVEVDDALIAVRCWWGREGAHFVVMRSGESIVAMRGEGGGLEEIGRIEVPEDAPVQVLAPAAGPARH